MPLITILGAADSRQVTTSKGAQKTIYFQRAQVESEQMRVGIELEIDDPTKGHDVGKKFGWDIVKDMVPGRFGIELARRQTLVDLTPAATAKQG